MPCWYYEKKDLVNTPSLRDGISAEVEARYRRDGARFIMDTGTKMGLRYDTCATGVVYFHRFYMFHSFKEFHRYVTAACCLFLAGKVEETPKKCKDIIKITQGMLSEQHFAAFGDDPKEEVITLERILLQTIKFDLMVEHPYAYLLKFAKLIKGDKQKTQSLVQMAWTFVNDSLCTTLCLQWEPEIIAVALMYLTSRLNKVEITDWHGKPAGYRRKWYEFFVDDVTLELLEDICHQVLDLYSNTPRARPEESPRVAHEQTSTKRSSSAKTTPRAPQEPDASANTVSPAVPAKLVAQHPSTTYSQTNPYLSAQMYSSSFMSQEGAQSIKSLMGVDHPAKPASYGSKMSATQAYQANSSAAVYNPAMFTTSAASTTSHGYSYPQYMQHASRPHSGSTEQHHMTTTPTTPHTPISLYPNYQAPTSRVARPSGHHDG